jgi:uncharacterized protein (TIGR02001 family)
MNNKFILASTLIACLAAPAVVLAQAAPAPAAAPTPEHTVTGNMTIATDYRFRGVSQTFGGNNFWAPAIQGGIDYSHSSGFYLGNWNSNVSGTQFPNGSSIEMDLYGGWKTTLANDIGLDFGTIYYHYPGSKFVGLPRAGGGTSTETIKNWEAYVGGSWKWFALKYFYSFTNYFGLSEDAVQTLCNSAANCSTPLARAGDTKGTQYLMGTFTYEVMPKTTLVAGLGYTWLRHYSALNYLDYKVGLTYDLNGWLLGAAVVGTDADDKYYFATNGDGKTRKVGNPNLVLSVGKTF